MKFAKIRKGEWMFCPMYVQVQDTKLDSIEVMDLNKRKFTVQGQKLIEETMFSATQFENEESVSQTKAAEILVNAGDNVLTAVFTKKDGSERTIICKLASTEHLLGRSTVMDLAEIFTGNPLRQVDHRTIKSIIIKGTKYTVK